MYSTVSHVALILGARPNFIKYAALHHALAHFPNLHLQVVHTGQHSDPGMSQVFFEEFGLPPADHLLGISGGDRGEQISRTMAELVKLWRQNRPDVVLLVGDVNASVSGALSADALEIPVCHYESGLRSFDRRMPEERNRMVMDALSSRFLCTEQAGRENLLREGNREKDISIVGNLLADTLRLYADRISTHDLVQKYGLQDRRYFVVTLHRPSNVDHLEGLTRVIQLLQTLSDRGVPVLFPVHPRTSRRFEEHNLSHALAAMANLVVMPPQSWVAFQQLQQGAALVVTDSGCVQEETTITGTPCLTFRENTERPVTVSEGTNELLHDLSPQRAGLFADSALAGRWKPGRIPEKWDGQAGFRVWQSLSSPSL